MTQDNSKKVCPRCKGKGSKVELDWGLGVLSFGITLLVNAATPEECNLCKGRGYVVGFK